MGLTYMFLLRDQKIQINIIIYVPILSFYAQNYLLLTRELDMYFKVMDMEHELQALRKQLAEKSKHYLRLQKEVCLIFC